MAAPGGATFQFLQRVGGFPVLEFVSSELSFCVLPVAPCKEEGLLRGLQSVKAEREEWRARCAGRLEERDEFESKPAGTD